MEEALRREIREETGLEVYDIELISLKESIYSNTFHKENHFIFIDYKCKTDSYEVILNDEAQEYVWINLEQIDNYDLDGFTESLLVQLRNEEKAQMTEIFYNN